MIGRANSKIFQPFYTVTINFTSAECTRDLHTPFRGIERW